MHIFTTTIEIFMGWLSLHQELAYLVLFLGAYFETLIGPGFFIFGEIFFLPGAILAGMGILNIWVVIALLYLGGILGDSSSYFIGRKVGMSVFKEENFLFNFKNYKKGENFFKKYGKKAIFLARLLGPLSWITPFLAGVFGIRYLDFLKYNIPGVLVGIGEFIVVGYFFGNQYKKILAIVQQYTLVAILCAVAIFLLVWYIRRIVRKNMKISLVIPAHNEEKYIKQCLESAIKNSNGKLHEIIVVNNASTDQTTKIVENFPEVKIIHESTKGLTRARQKGLENASGDLIAYIDADTLMPNGWIEKATNAFLQNDKIVCISGPYKYHDVAWHMKLSNWLFWNLLGRISYLVAGYMVVGGNFVAKKEALKKINGFDSTIEFYGEDTDIAKRLSRVGKVRFIYKLHMPTSGRRFKGDGLIKTGARYLINFVSTAMFGKPATKKYTDIR